MEKLLWGVFVLVLLSNFLSVWAIVVSVCAYRANVLLFRLLEDKTSVLQVPVEEAPDTTDAWGNP